MIRRSSGRNIYLNRLLLRKPRPDLDLAAFHDGVVLKASGGLRRFEDIGNPGAMSGGALLLAKGRPIEYRGSRTGQVFLTGPFELNEIGRMPPFGRSVTRLLLSTADGDFELWLFTVDLDLFRLALASTALPAPPPPAASADPVTRTRKAFRVAANLAMILYFLEFAVRTLGSALTITGLAVVFTGLWAWTVRSRFEGLVATVEARFPRDPRLLRDALFSVAYIGGLVAMPWIPPILINIWLWGIIVWLPVAAVTLLIRLRNSR